MPEVQLDGLALLGLQLGQDGLDQRLRLVLPGIELGEPARCLAGAVDGAEGHGGVGRLGRRVAGAVDGAEGHGGVSRLVTGHVVMACFLPLARLERPLGRLGLAGIG
jgi:hypothetical protein